jgi:ketosteroid isomerase-like protein
MTTVSELQASAWDAECRHDFDALLGHFLPDATFHQSNGRRHHGHAAIRTMTEEFCREYPGCSVEILREYGDGETSAAIEFRATITDVDGNVSVLQGVQLVEVQDGRFKSVRGYEEQPVRVLPGVQS